MVAVVFDGFFAVRIFYKIMFSGPYLFKYSPLFCMLVDFFFFSSFF